MIYMEKKDLLQSWALPKKGSWSGCTTTSGNMRKSVVRWVVDKHTRNITNDDAWIVILSTVQKHFPKSANYVTHRLFGLKLMHGLLYGHLL
jgi:hypothetical protein